VGTFDNQVQNGIAAAPPPAITPAMKEYLQQTKPWVRFMSVLGFIAVALMVLCGFAVMIFSASMSSRFGPSGVPMAFLGFIYLVLGLIYVFPAIFLYRYADGIKKAITVDLVGGMEDALRSQKSFWRYVGIIALIILIVYAIILVGLILFGIFNALR